MNTPANQPSRSGFTLIELSIVLVIIGLIIGGVLVGRDLIEAAKIRSAVSQIEQFKSASNAFRLKYRCLPGDCANAADFGFAAREGTPGRGDSNGTLEGTNGLAYGNICPDGTNGCLQGLGETALFWRDLSEAKLIKDNFSIAVYWPLPSGAISNTSSPALKDYFPASAMGNNNYVIVYSEYSVNGFALMGTYTNTGSSAYVDGSTLGLAAYPGLTPSQAYAIDQKVDDGLPQSGQVLARMIYGSLGFPWVRGQNSAGIQGVGADPGQANARSDITCYDNDNNASAAATYSLTNPTYNCSLTLRF